jgi:ATP-dependent protease HslVU (ClpYQ) peptidase subunit
MTVIAGAVAADGEIHMGGDSAGISGYHLCLMAEPKVFANGAFLIGFTSSFRMGDLLRYADLPIYREEEEKGHHRFMVQKFIPAVRTIFKDSGYMSVQHQREEGGVFLVGFSGHLFAIWEDLQVASSTYGMLAIGCGGQVALGAMIAMQVSGMALDESLVDVTLKSSERASAGVRSPFVILRNPPKTAEGEHQ